MTVSMGDIFALQDDITLAVVEALKLKLLGAERAAVLKRYTDNAEAYELFLKGRYHSYKYTAEGWNRAIEFFEKAIALQPDYALAYAGLAAARTCLWYFGLLPADQTIPAVPRQPTNRHSPSTMAWRTRISRWPVSRSSTTGTGSEPSRCSGSRSRSIRTTPRRCPTSRCFSPLMGRVDEAIKLNREALKLDPLAPLIGMNCGWTYFSAGMSDEASQQAAKMIESEPGFFGGHWLQGAIRPQREASSTSAVGAAEDGGVTRRASGRHRGPGLGLQSRGTR